LVVQAKDGETFQILKTFVKCRLAQASDNFSFSIWIENDKMVCDKETGTLTASLLSSTLPRGNKLKNMIDFLTDTTGSESLAIDFVDAKALKRIRALKDFTETVTKWKEKAEKSLGDVNINGDKNPSDEIKTLSSKMMMKKLLTTEELRKACLEEQRQKDQKSLQEQELELRRLQVKEFHVLCDKLIREASRLSPNDQNYEAHLNALSKKLGLDIIHFEQKMPIFGYRSQIIETVKNNQVTILVAETGSGKSTQVARYM
jgi:ABC-type multidrug transport system fused ATPase/permease subunit